MLRNRSFPMSAASSQPSSSAWSRLIGRFTSVDPVIGIFTVVLAGLTYAPSFLTRPGFIASDSKQYLYLDPGKLLSSAISMWDPDVGAGTVTHQNIGFLFPMGPYYWIVRELHISMWVGQRFWMGSLFFFAGTGVLFAARLLGLSRWGCVAAALMYTFTPFVIDYIGRISVILMPWAALGWMVGLVILAVRRGGWRHPALFAIVVALVGGVNATSILLVGLAPFLWLLYAVFITREATLRRVLGAVLRLGVLCVGVSLWWAAGLWAEGAYGLNILRFTETIPTVTSTSLSSEVLRGLGYWYFYGQDKLQPWTSASLGYTQTSWIIAVSFAVPALCVALGALARWRYRAFAVVLVLTGVIIAVAAYPFADASPLGRVLKAAGSESTIGLALRSSNRVIPLVLLGLALLLGSGITALVASNRWLGWSVLALAAALILANLTPLWEGTLVATNLARPQQLPRYVTKAATYLNSTGGDTRVLGVPGEDFGYYRYGVTTDPVWPGLLDRPYLARQVVPQGEPASVNLLQALDESVEDGVFVPSTLVPIAQLFSAGDILFESDEQYERFNTARPQPLYLQLTNPATGLGPPVTFGKPTTFKTLVYPLQDETQLAVPTAAPLPPPVAVFSVPNPRPLVRAESTSVPLVVAGDGQGLVNAAPTGLLDAGSAIFYSASLAKDPRALQGLLGDGAVLVLTDTNQRQADTWGSITDNEGYVEQAGENPPKAEPGEVSLPAVPGTGSDTQTVTTLSSVKSIRASTYGNPITNAPEDRAFNAFDGNPDTRWAEGAFSAATGATLTVTLEKPVTASHITLLQPQTGPRNRHVTRVTLSFNHGPKVRETLIAASRRPPGQTVSFAPRTFSSLSIRIDATSSGIRTAYNGYSGVGFADVTIPGVAPVVQTLRLPTDLLRETGAASLSHELVVLFNRLRAPAVPPRSDPEPTLSRSFTLPTARTFNLGGTARVSTLDPDPVIDQILGRTAAGPALTSLGAPVAPPTAGTGPGTQIVFANSSGRLPGDLNAGAYAAVDGNPFTAWMPGFGKQVGSWVSYSFNRPITLSSLDLQVVTDGRHAIPTELTVSMPSGSERVPLPAIADGRGRPQGSTTTVPISFGALSGQQVKITIDAVRKLKERDYYSGGQQTFPVGLAELGLPATAPSTPPVVPTRCLAGLLSIDGTPLDVSVSGTSASALDGDGLVVGGCGDSANGITLSAGTHVLTTTPYEGDGLTLDALSLSSAAGGGPLPLTAAGQIPPPISVPGPAVKVLHQGRTQLTVSVTGHGSPYWLVLGQSQSRGWEAQVKGGPSLGTSTLIDGYANGWLIGRSLSARTLTVQMTWTPQRVVDAALLLSGATLAASLVLAVVPRSFLPAAWDRVGGFARRRLRRNAKGRAAAPLVAATTAVALDERETNARDTPSLASALSSDGRRPSWIGLILWPLATGLVAGAITARIAAPIVAGLVLLGLLVRRSRLLFVLPPIFLLLAAGDYVMVTQRQLHYKPDIGWATKVGTANTLAWMALAALLAGAVVEVARSRPWRLDDGPAEAIEAPAAALLPIGVPAERPPELTVHVATHRERVLSAPHPDEGPGATAIALPAVGTEAGGSAERAGAEEVGGPSEPDAPETPPPGAAISSSDAPPATGAPDSGTDQDEGPTRPTEP
jgi:arabinofuranan 3-O-arabinosyltransferase